MSSFSNSLCHLSPRVSVSPRHLGRKLRIGQHWQVSNESPSQLIIVPNVGLKHHVVQRLAFEFSNDFPCVLARGRAHLKRYFCRYRKKPPSALFLERQHAHVTKADLHIHAVGRDGRHKAQTTTAGPAYQPLALVCAPRTLNCVTKQHVGPERRAAPVQWPRPLR